MKGICISFNPSNVGSVWPVRSDTPPAVHAVPPDDTPFCFFFRPVFPYMRDLYWFASGFYSSPFVRRSRNEAGEEELEAVGRMEVGLDDDNEALHRPGTLPDLASSVHNDWINLIGLRLDEDEAVSVARRLSAAEEKEFDRYVGEEAELAFYCLDGFSWEMYPRDPALLELVARPLRGVDGISVSECDSSNRDALWDG